MPLYNDSIPNSPSNDPQLITSRLLHLIRFPNQTGTLLLMLPTFWALVLAAEGTPPLKLLAIFASGAFLMRSAGVIINDLADRKFDREVLRTKTRPLANGTLSPPQAFLFLTVLLLIAFLLLWFLNPLARWLSPVALGLATLYPFTKRFCHVPQFFLGLAFGWGTIMAWAAVQQNLAMPAWCLFGTTVCWALAYDTIYALQDREDDRLVGVKSSAILFGPSVWIAVGGAELLMLTFLIIAGLLVDLNFAFYGVLAAIAGFLSQQVWHLRNDISPAQAFVLFRQHVAVGLIILMGLWLGTL